MKTLYLVRHAKSSWAQMGMRDIERPLEQRGLNDAPRMAEWMRNLGAKPDLLVSSPAVRARTTAAFFAQAFGIAPENIDIQTDVYEASTTDIRQVVRSLPDEAREVFLFGHNPTFTYFANLFSTDEIDDLPTCGIVKIDANIDNWKDFSENNAKRTGFWYPKKLK